MVFSNRVADKPSICSQNELLTLVVYQGFKKVAGRRGGYEKVGNKFVLMLGHLNLDHSRCTLVRLRRKAWPPKFGVADKAIDTLAP